MATKPEIEAVRLATGGTITPGTLRPIGETNDGCVMPIPRPTPSGIHNIRLNLAHVTSRVELDGHDISDAITTVNVHSQAGELTTVEIGVHVGRAIDIEGKALVVLPPPVVAALTALGWTPPGARLDRKDGTA